MRRSRLLQCKVMALFVLLARPSAARLLQTSTCANQPAPTLVTLRASTLDASNAEVVYPNCTIVSIASTASNGTTISDVRNLGIQVVSSFPDVATVLLAGNQVTTIYENLDATVKNLDLSSNGLSSLDALKIPSTVTRLSLDNNSIMNLDVGDIPDTVTSLSLKNNGIVVLTTFIFSNNLQTLDTSDNKIRDLSKWRMPPHLQQYSCTNCDITKISGVVLPYSGSLIFFDLGSSTVDSFEIADSSIPLIAGLRWVQLTVSSTNCRDPSATKRKILTLPLCVLPDAVYNSKFVISATTSDTSSTLRLPPIGLQPANLSTDSTSSGWMMAATISGAALVVVLIAGTVGYFVSRYRRSTAKYWVNTDDRRSSCLSVATISRNIYRHTLTAGSMEKDEYFESSDPNANSKFQGMKSAMNSSTLSVASNSDRYLDNDIRTDQDMRHFRLLDDEVKRGKLIAKGGYGAVYKASFRGKTVVAKQLLPNRARDPRMLNNFMDEIRTCSSLEHPKIVTFIGFTFSSLVDLSAVFEYLSNGDLATLLQKQLKRETRDPMARESYGWFRSSKSNRGDRKCKSLIALDIAEGLVYLHSFENPIIHRDLKPSNILLSETWEAKLTDFGVSRELREDQTMTAEIGTMSWIAPEVLRGERYSEKADVYSFGVIMTELDTCRRPYSEVVSNGDKRHDKIEHSNARIAVLVSAGSLRPSLSLDCPDSVRKLVDKCLDGNPLKRPSALQLHFELRKLEHELDEGTTRLLRNQTMSISRKSSHRAMLMPRSNSHPLHRTSNIELEPQIVMIESNDIALLSSEGRDHGYI